MSGRGFRFEDGVAWIGDRSFPWASKVSNTDIPMRPDLTFRDRHVWLTFENGWTLSVSWGAFSYSVNHDSSIDPTAEWHEESPNAELWGTSGITGCHVSESPEGYLTPAQVLAWVDQVSRWASDYVPVCEPTFEGSE